MRGHAGFLRGEGGGPGRGEARAAKGGFDGRSLEGPSLRSGYAAPACCAARRRCGRSARNQAGGRRVCVQRPLPASSRTGVLTMRTTVLAGSLVGLAVLLAPVVAVQPPRQHPRRLRPRWRQPPRPRPRRPRPDAGAVPSRSPPPASERSSVDGGMTLYVFAPDNAGASTCYDDCEKAWPVLVGSVTAGTGLTPATSARSPARTAAPRSRSTVGRCTTSPRTRPRVTSPGRASATPGTSWMGGRDGRRSGGLGRYRRGLTGCGIAPRARDTSLGKVLVDGKGMTLYMFTADSKDTSTCYEACAQNWPPVLGTAAPGDGARRRGLRLDHPHRRHRPGDVLRHAPLPVRRRQGGGRRQRAGRGGEVVRPGR